jgi:hypothetical protein
MVVAPRSNSSLGSVADPVFGDLPAGTLIAVAEDSQHANVTNFWVGSTWKSSDAAQTQLNNVIDAYHHGQGSLFDDLRLEIESFARSDSSSRLSKHQSISKDQREGDGGEPADR